MISLLFFFFFFFLFLERGESVKPFYLIEPESVFMYYDCSHEVSYDDRNFQAVFLIDALRQHPQRVIEKEKAELVIVPALFDLLALKRCKSKHTGPTYVNQTISLIYSTNLYPAKRHVLLMFDWRFPYYYEAAYDFIRMDFPRVIVATSYEETKKDCEYAIPYANYYDYSYFYPMTKERRRNHYHRLIDDGKDLIPVLRNDSTAYETFLNRKIFIEFTGTVETRHASHDGYLLFNKSNSFFHKSFSHPVWITTTANPRLLKRGFIESTVEDCKNYSSIDYRIKNIETFQTSNHRCRMSLTRQESQLIRENSKFSLCFHGDTMKSARWINSILAGAIIVVIAESLSEAILWAPLKDIIPWGDMIIVLSPGKFYENPIQSINQLAEIPRHEIERKLTLMKKHASDLSFIAQNSRFVDNFIDAALKANCSHDVQ